MNRVQPLAAVFLLDALACCRVLVDKAAQQAISLLEAGAQRRVGQALFHGHLIAHAVEVTTGFLFHELQVQLGILPVQRSLRRGVGRIGLLGLKLIPAPHAHADQGKDGKRQQNNAHEEDQNILDAAKNSEHAANPLKNETGATLSAMKFAAAYGWHSRKPNAAS